MGECCLCGKHTEPNREFGNLYYCQNCIEKCFPLFDYFVTKIQALKEQQFKRIVEIYKLQGLEFTAEQLERLKKELLK